MFCRNCGANNADNAAFCVNCGEALNAEQPVQQPVEQQPVYQQPVQQPVEQQPVYQQPVQQPVYQQPVQQPVYQQPPVAGPVPGKGMGIAGMVLGIFSLVFFCFWYLALPCAIVAVILSGISMKKAKEVGGKNGMATAGVVCSSIALGITLFFVIIFVIAGVGGALNFYY